MIACGNCGTENPARAKYCSECGAPLPSRCVGCGEELPADARFCPACGTPVEAAASAPEVPPEERRTVTILFVDLVGFTARSDMADPEDVRRTLVPFHSRVKDEIERFGGTLDKFIGDAVMGVFGAPIAHEDDPARAVRAALHILRAIDELRRSDPGIAVRVAVNTGEAVVAFGSGPQVGEAVAGDVVNTTSRMQSLAPDGSLVIGETTLRVVRGLFDVELLAPATVKGKAAPLKVWRVLGERTHAPVDVAPTTFVGREYELEVLRGLFDRAAGSSTMQFVTLFGEPGLGKTRLVAEFHHRLAGRGRWVRGRCLPYGDDVTFAPVAATLREIAGIEQGGDGGALAERLGSFAERVEPDAGEREWLVSRLRPILGIGGGEDGGTIPAVETADAWARVASSAAGDRPLIVELEDLHWAEPVLIEVIERFADGLARLPVLLLCTARPELLERHEHWGSGRRDATTIGLTALTEAETERLLSTLLAQVTLAAPARASLLERAGGNPLYALEFARMLGDHAARHVEADEPAMPETVQAVIAARLDAIPRELRSLVQDAAVLGTSFWPGALAAMGERPEDEVRSGIDELVRRGLAQPAAASAFDDQPEFGFGHALIREVAYARIPRAQRARLHRTAGDWIAAAGRDRADERAETLAMHYASSVELADAASDREAAEAARGPAVRWLVVAGEQLSRLDAAGAFALFDRAVHLGDGDSRESAEALALSAQMGRRSGRIDANEVLRRHEAALVVHRILDDPMAIGASLTRVGSQLGAMGETASSREHLAEAVEVLESQPPGRELARAYAYRAEEEMYAGRVDESMRFAERTLELLDRDGYDELVVMALHIRGDARCSIGEPHGLDDLREALRVAEIGGNAYDVVTSQNYLSEWLSKIEGPAAGIAFADAALALAERRGVASQAQWTKATAMESLFEAGEWDRALSWSRELLEVGRDRLDGTVYATARISRSNIALLRGRPQDADAPEDLLALARPVEELQVLAPALAVAAALELAAGDAAAAAGHLREFADVTRGVAAQYREAVFGAVARDCVAAGEVALAREMVEEGQGVVLRDRLNVLSARAVVTEAEGDLAAAAPLYAEAAEGWRAYGDPLEEAEALRGRVRCGGGGADDEARAAKLFAALGVPGRA